ncbi:MarR family winged helix-turn-helix transcriptional regulator [Nocardioidaceae bacterium]|nr:MarR family winged helix-turn-helix transcriptional regulator [Nocardioidaceae bacterium]
MSQAPPPSHVPTPPSHSGVEGEVPWLSADEQEVWRAYVVGSTWLLDQLDRELQTRHRVSLSEYEVLVRLSEAHEHRCRMAVLSDSLRHSRSRMTHTVGRLERAGLVRREPAASDGRGVDAVLEPAGLELLRRAAPDHVRGVRRWFVDQGSREQLAAVGHVFGRITDTLTEGHPDADIR